MITCLGRQGFYVGDNDYNDGGGEGDGGGAEVSEQCFEDRIRIRILFEFQKMPEYEYEYYSAFQN